VNGDQSLRFSRRAAIASAGLAAAATALVARAGSAQEATPAAESAQPEFLFVQGFGAGALEPIAGQAGDFQLMLDGGVSRTLYFSDRPERITGVIPTAEYLEALTASEDDPPNAALVTEVVTGAGDATEAVWIVTLLGGVYDAEARQLRYDARIIEPEDSRFAMTSAEAPAGAVALGAGHLFIDDLNGYIYVNNMTGRTIPVGIYKSPPNANPES
jgi:hypothetical protein